MHVSSSSPSIPPVSVEVVLAELEMQIRATGSSMVV